MSNGLDPVQDRDSASPELAPNCFQRFISRQQKSEERDKINRKLFLSHYLILSFSVSFCCCG